MNIREVPFFNKISVNGIAFIIGEDKPFTGKLVCRYPSDILKEEETYQNGIKDGVSKKFYQNGILKRDGRIQRRKIKW